jgi:hypothetical protein
VLREHTPQPQTRVPAPGPQTPDPRPRPRTPETHPLSGLEHMGILTAQKPHPRVPSQRGGEAAGNGLDVDVDQQLLIESAGGDSLPDIPLPDISLPDDPLPNDPLPNVPLSEALPDGSVGKD